MASDREKRLELILAQFIQPIRGIPFEVVIRALCGVAVERFDTTVPANAGLLQTFIAAMTEAVARVQEAPIIRRRANEVGNAMEPFVMATLNDHGLVATAPRTRTGLGKSTGYPDLRIATADRPIYLEVKTYASENFGTMRSFYLSPAEDPKVFEDGYHLLVAFEMKQDGGSYLPIAFKLVDLYGLDCDMKAEFNSNNRRLYQPERVLASKRFT